METVTDIMDTAAATADLSRARQRLLHSLESLRENLAVPVLPDGSPDIGIDIYRWRQITFKIHIAMRKSSFLFENLLFVIFVFCDFFFLAVIRSYRTFPTALPKMLHLLLGER